MTLLFYSTVDSAARWQAELQRLTRELDIRVWPEIGDPAEIDYALVWRPEPGLLAALPNLKLILSLGAGVDHLLGRGRDRVETDVGEEDISRALGNAGPPERRERRPVLRADEKHPDQDDDGDRA